jgi:hypothetical protein
MRSQQSTTLIMHWKAYPTCCLVLIEGLVHSSSLQTSNQTVDSNASVADEETINWHAVKTIV